MDPVKSFVSQSIEHLDKLKRDYSSLEKAITLGKAVGSHVFTLGLSIYVYKRSLPNIYPLPEAANRLFHEMKEHHIFQIPKNFPRFVPHLTQILSGVSSMSLVITLTNRINETVLKKFEIYNKTIEFINGLSGSLKIRSVTSGLLNPFQVVKLDRLLAKISATAFHCIALLTLYYRGASKSTIALNLLLGYQFGFPNNSVSTFVDNSFYERVKWLSYASFPEDRIAYIALTSLKAPLDFPKNFINDFFG